MKLEGESKDGEKASIKYGSKGQTWSEEFIDYMESMVAHPVYANMPDAIKDDGKIQWEAPSNRSGGNYQFTYNKRRDWWIEKAKSLGIDTNVNQWISKTAKLIHPTGEKPCKRCGNILKIAYVYPNKNLVKKLKKEFGKDFPVSPLDEISEIITLAFDAFGESAIQAMSKVLSTTKIKVPDFSQDLDALLSWVDESYIPKEPSLLSPGVMANPPDRFDGFHSFNRCCRSKADTGRHASNLKSYNTDRRVFEFWSEGDWIAANRLMGLVKSKLNNEPCADGGTGPPTSDHVGPISLGFCHRPEFKLLSREANSAKNNRMSFEDVKSLIKSQNDGILITSWYATPLWNMRKNSVKDEETALRISKLLRDNQRNAMHLLTKVYDAGLYSVLIYLLELDFADRSVQFENLRVEDFITKYDRLKVNKRETKYAVEQKARRIRIGFEALMAYKAKSNRHSFIVAEKSMNKAVKELSSFLPYIKGFKDLNKSIKKVLLPKNGIIEEKGLRDLVSRLPKGKIKHLDNAKAILVKPMRVVGKVLSDLWDDERYIRS